MWNKYVFLPFLFILILIQTTCIDPYNPKLEKYQSLMVVNALLTDGDTPFTVNLTRTTISPDAAPDSVSGARVSVSDDAGNTTFLREVSAGVYAAESKSLKAEGGRKYALRIQTYDGKEYESDPAVLSQSGSIDTLYYLKAARKTADGELQEGIMIYIDSKGTSESRFYRWGYEEWWKFSIPYPVTYQYIDEDHIYPVPVKNVTCFKNRNSDEILIQATGEGESPEFNLHPVCFIPSEKSNRLLIQYFIEVTQYSISENEYEFWRRMKEINESGGDIFNRQPYQIMSNIHCVSNPEEMVLGYFHISGVSRKSIYIKGSDITALGLKPYSYECDVVMKGPDDYLSEKPVTFDRIYYNYIMLGYNFISPHFTFSNNYDRLIFADTYCSDCATSGTPYKPDFWIDLE